MAFSLNINTTRSCTYLYYWLDIWLILNICKHHFEQNNHYKITPYFLQVLFQAIKIYTVSRCTLKNYQNLPGIVEHAIVNKKKYTAISTKTKIQDNLLDVNIGIWA